MANGTTWELFTERGVTNSFVAIALLTAMCQIIYELGLPIVLIGGCYGYN